MGTKATKTGVERTVPLDAETVQMVLRHCQRMDERAAVLGVKIADDAFTFSLNSSCDVTSGGVPARRR